MIDAWLKECPYLAPYLKEKLAADKKHTWRDAPYIHEDVREALAEDEPRPTYVRPEYAMPSYSPRLGYMPPYDIWNAAGAFTNAMMPIRAGTEINMGISAQVNSLDVQVNSLDVQADSPDAQVDSLYAQLRQAERNLYINQQLLQNEILLGMMNLNRDIWGF